MIKITEKSREFTKVEQYLMTVAPSIISAKDVEDGTKITVTGVLEFTDIKDDGTETEIMSIITPDNGVYSCQSSTFKRSIHDIMEIMDGEPFTIVKTSGETKAGRDYINCFLDTDSIIGDTDRIKE